MLEGLHLQQPRRRRPAVEAVAVEEGGCAGERRDPAPRVPQRIVDRHEGRPRRAACRERQSQSADQRRCLVLSAGQTERFTDSLKWTSTVAAHLSQVFVLECDSDMHQPGKGSCWGLRCLYYDEAAAADGRAEYSAHCSGEDAAAVALRDEGNEGIDAEPLLQRVRPVRQPRAPRGGGRPHLLRRPAVRAPLR